MAIVNPEQHIYKLVDYIELNSNGQKHVLEVGRATGVILSTARRNRKWEIQDGGR